MKKALFVITALLLVILTACSVGEGGGKTANETALPEVTGSMELKYAREFKADTLEGGYTLVTIGGSERYLLVPEGAKMPEGIGTSEGAGAPEGAEGNLTVLNVPLDDIYLASSASTDLFFRAGAKESIAMTSTPEESWSIPDIREAVSKEEIFYAGKYSSPDYEALLEAECDLALENTMIYHAPETMEKLEKIGIPVMVERSSYEKHPLGRVEWIKLYGLLTGHEEEAARFFERCEEQLEEIDVSGSSGKSVIFFYITPSGLVNVRRSNDYVAEMIRMAGGKYIPEKTDDDTQSAKATMNMQMEMFYEAAKEADILIYNSTIDGGIGTVDELIAKEPLLAGFKAVKEGNAWCTGQNMFQQVSGTADMITDLYKVINGKDDKLKYLYRLEDNREDKDN